MKKISPYHRPELRGRALGRMESEPLPSYTGDATGCLTFQASGGVIGGGTKKQRKVSKSQFLRCIFWSLISQGEFRSIGTKYWLKYNLPSPSSK